jgi:hypothetical protein
MMMYAHPPGPGFPEHPPSVKISIYLLYENSKKNEESSKMFFIPIAVFGKNLVL